MSWQQLGLQFMLTVVGGALGAWLVHRLDWQQFRQREQYREKTNVREALREVLAIEQGIRELGPVRDADAKKKGDDFGERLMVLRPMFEHDPELRIAITTLGAVATSHEWVRHHDCSTSLDNAVVTVRQRLLGLEKELME